jgi:cytochrome c biogenesis protein
MSVEPETAFTTHADPMDARVTAPQAPGIRGWLRWLWARLTSMRTALILLILLGIAAIPGSLVPQRTSDPIAVSALIREDPQRAQWYERFGLFDVYGSVWFSAIYLLLFISLVGCLVPRARQHWRMWRRSPGPPPAALARLPDSVDVAHAASDDAVAAAAAALRAGRWRVRTGPGWVAGEKGFVRETGNQAFHFALLGVLAAVGFGALTGWQGNVVVTEDSGFANSLPQYDTFTAGRFADVDRLPPFSVRLQDFDVQFERGEAQRGAPRDFRADVLVTPEPGAVPQRRTFAVNNPLRLDGADIYLIGHGYAPHIIVRNADGEVVFDDSVVFLPQDANFTSAGVVKVPDSEPQLGFRGLFLPTALIDPQTGPTSIFPAPDAPGLFLSAFSGDLGLDSGEPQNVYRLDDSAMEQIGLKALAVGQTWQLPDGAGSVQFAGYDRWISVKVASDPGGAWALLFVGLAILGMSLSLFVRRRRVWVVRADGGVTVGGVARGDKVSMADDVAELVAAIGPRESREGSTR